MSRIAYVNGRYLRHAEAGVSIDDRAFVFGDGLYEVCEVRAGAMIDEPRHLARLARSLAALRIDAPLTEAALRRVMREVIARNRVHDGLVYLQVSRGAARRDHGFPAGPTRPGLVVTAKSLDPRLNEARASTGVRVITQPDERWAHPHVKTLQLLPNVLGKQAAREAGAFESWFVDKDGFITDGASTNAWIVTSALVTRQIDAAILAQKETFAAAGLVQDQPCVPVIAFVMPEFVPMIARLIYRLERALQVAQVREGAGQHVECLRARSGNGAGIPGVINSEPCITKGILKSMETDVDFGQISVDVGGAVDFAAGEIA